MIRSKWKKKGRNEVRRESPHNVSQVSESPMRTNVVMEEEQHQLSLRHGMPVDQVTLPSQLQNPSLAQLQLIEAEWVSNEHDEFIKMIQRYRSLYVTAIFLAFGWALGQVLSSQATTLEALRSRTDVAAVLAILPLINVLFAMLMLEAHAHAADLARYRFLLGKALNDGSPPWRWNRWREKHKSSVLRRPTMILNIFSAVLFLFVVAGAFWFSVPALKGNSWLWVLWGPSLGIFIAFLMAVGIVGIYWLRGEAVVTRHPEYTEEWTSLGDDQN
jgi:hypothetical protein